MITTSSNFKLSDQFKPTMPSKDSFQSQRRHPSVLSVLRRDSFKSFRFEPHCTGCEIPATEHEALKTTKMPKFEDLQQVSELGGLLTYMFILHLVLAFQIN